MNTIAQDLDDLDRMIDQGAAQDKIRSQIRLIHREVSALEAEYASLAQSHSELQQAHSELKASQATPPFRPPPDIGPATYAPE